MTGPKWETGPGPKAETGPGPKAETGPGPKAETGPGSCCWGAGSSWRDPWEAGGAGGGSFRGRGPRDGDSWGRLRGSIRLGGAPERRDDAAS